MRIKKLFLTCVFLCMIVSLTGCFENKEIKKEDETDSKKLVEETKKTEDINGNQLYEIGTPIQYEWNNSGNKGLANITLNRVCSYVCTEESIVLADSNEGKRMLYIDYTVENISDVLWNVNLYGIKNLWADDKSCELEPLIFFTYLGDADMYGFYHESGSDKLRKGAKDEYYVVYKVDVEQYEVIELELYNGISLLLKQGNDNCIEIAGESEGLSDNGEEASEFSDDSNEALYDNDFDAQWYRTYNNFVMLEENNTIEFITYDIDDFVDIAINGVTVDSFVPDNYNYDEQWEAYMYYSTSNEITFAYRPNDRKILILSGDYVGEYQVVDY